MQPCKEIAGADSSSAEANKFRDADGHEDGASAREKSGASDDRTDDHRRIVRPLVEEQSIIKLQVKQYLRGILLCVSCVDASTIATSKPRLLQVVASPHLLTPLKSPKRMR